MFKLDQKDYLKVAPLVKSNMELSVLSVIDGIIPGEIYVNNLSVPSAALIQTSECNLLAGSSDDTAFNSALSEELDFWDTVTPDSEGWISVIPFIHKNKFVRRYTRRCYSLSVIDKPNRALYLTDGYYVEPVIPSLIRQKQYENSEKIIEWIEGWGNDQTFCAHGVGSYVRNENTIVSWSISDCCYGDKIAIGVRTDERFRKKGFGLMAVSETIKGCFERGYKTIRWLCVDTNKGSIAIAEKLCFVLQQKYVSFTSYPPIENITDLSEIEWNEWGSYLEEASLSEPNLKIECLFAYIKANNIKRATEVSTRLNNEERTKFNYNGFISYLHCIGMGTNFPDDWMKGELK